MLEGVNVKQGLSLCGNDYFSYVNLLRVIYNDGMNQINKLKFACDQNNMEDYRITVHAMKSVTASAGDEQLSNICRIHEENAKNGDTEYIRNNVNDLIRLYRELMKKIDTALQRENSISGKAMPKSRVDAGEDNIVRMSRDLKYALESFDVDEAEKILDQFDGVVLTKEQEAAVAKVREYLLLFNYDEALKAWGAVFKE